MRNLILNILLGGMIILPQNLAQSRPGVLFSIVPDAHSQAIGNANPAVLNGAAAQLSNPALLGYQRRVSLEFSNFLTWSDFNYGSFALTIPVGLKSTVGLAGIGAVVPGIEEYSRDGLFLGEINNYQMGISLGYAYQMTPFAIGLSIKIFQMSLSGIDFDRLGRGFGLDFGGGYQVSSALRVGFAFQSDYDIYWENNYSEQVPRQAKLGVEWSPVIQGQRFISLSYGLTQVRTHPMTMHIGTTLVLVDHRKFPFGLQLHGGIGDVFFEVRRYQIDLNELITSNIKLSSGISLIAGREQKGHLCLNYAYRFREVLGDLHVITTEFRF